MFKETLILQPIEQLVPNNPEWCELCQAYKKSLYMPVPSPIACSTLPEKVLRQEIQLIRVQDNQLTDALLVTLTDKHLNDFEQVWKAQLRASTEEDRFWDWEMKNRVYLSESNYEGYAIECEEMTQGMMLIETRVHRSWYASRRRVIYIHSLATAPWNRRSLATPTYRAVGGLLMEFARYRSQELGYGGLVGVHSLPDAEDFYRRMGMIECGADEEKENLVYFEWYRQQESEFEAWDILE